MKPVPIVSTMYDQLPVSIYESNQDMGLAAALDAQEILKRAIAERGEANIILAAANSQRTFFQALRTLDRIDWSKVRVFHMDEYVGIDPNHPASFPRFLREHILDAVKPRAFYPVPGQAHDLEKACQETRPY
jgi:glucosamine-6-phosphate deaminase